MNEYHHEMGGAGDPKEGFGPSLEAMRRELRYTAEAHVDGAMMTPPFREVASLVLEEIAVELKVTPLTPQGIQKDYALGA